MYGEVRDVGPGHPRSVLHQLGWILMRWIILTVMVVVIAAIGHAASAQRMPEQLNLFDPPQESRSREAPALHTEVLP